MKWYNIVERNTRASILVKDYFSFLESRLIEEIYAISEKQVKTAINYPEASLVEFHTPRVGSDKNGHRFTEFRSSLGQLRLYVNIPIGWIYGEVRLSAPPIGQSKCFAVTLEKTDNEKFKIINLGCYESLSILGFSEMLDYLAEKMVTDLTLGIVEKIHLQDRTRLLNSSEEPMSLEEKIAKMNEAYRMQQDAVRLKAGERSTSLQDEHLRSELLKIDGPIFVDEVYTALAERVKKLSPTIEDPSKKIQVTHGGTTRIVHLYAGAAQSAATLPRAYLILKDTLDRLVYGVEIASGELREQDLEWRANERKIQPLIDGEAVSVPDFAEKLLDDFIKVIAPSAS